MEEHEVLQRFLQTSKQYLTALPVGTGEIEGARSRSARDSSTRSTSLQRSVIRRKAQANVVWAFAARHRLP